MEPNRQAEIDALRICQLMTFPLPQGVLDELQARLVMIKNGEDPY